MPRSPAVITTSASFHDGGSFLSMRSIWRQAQSHSCQVLSQMSGSNPCESRRPQKRDLVGRKGGGRGMLAPCLYSSSAVCVERDR